MAKQAPKYDMAHPHVGVALIIINTEFKKDLKLKDRPGQTSDATKFGEVLLPLGFDVRTHIDQTATQMLHQVTRVAKEAHKDWNCFLFVLSTHGDSRDETGQFCDIVYGTDGEITLAELLEPMRGTKCSSLAGKPKLYFIQACRGIKLDGKVKVTSLKGSGKVEEAESVHHEGSHITRVRREYVPEDYNMPYRVPIFKDFLLAYATPPGFLAFKTPDGSPFLRYLCDHLASEGTKVDIMTLLTRVNRDMARGYESNIPTHSSRGLHQRKGMPWVASMLTKQLIFVSKP